jgi:hypothetical protein
VIAQVAGWVDILEGAEICDAGDLVILVIKVLRRPG